MALALGTNSGFVTVAPTTDPAASLELTIDGNSLATKDTTPSGVGRITEIGWYRAVGTNTSNFEVGLYSDNAGVPDVRLEVAATNSSSSAGWITVSVNWTISASTDYWLALQMDAHTLSSTIDRETTGGSGYDFISGGGQTTLNNPFGGGAVAQPAGMAAIYALVAPAFTPAWGAKATTIIGGAF